jgi:hypothetical protein
MQLLTWFLFGAARVLRVHGFAVCRCLGQSGHPPLCRHHKGVLEHRVESKHSIGHTYTTRRGGGVCVDRVVAVGRITSSDAAWWWWWRGAAVRL